MQSGSFDERIALYTYAAVVSETTGSFSKTWSKVRDIWARVKPYDTGREYVDADRRENVQKAIFEVRFAQDITVGDRIVFQGNSYNIISKREIDRRMYLRIEAQFVEAVYPTGEVVQGLLRVNATGLLRISATGLLKI